MESREGGAYYGMMSEEVKNQIDAPELTAKRIAAPIFGLPEGLEAKDFAKLMAEVKTKRIDAKNPIPEPETLINMGNAPILRRGGLCIVCGTAGTRKTSALTLLCADAMRPGHIKNSPFTFAASKQLRVLYIDPEQHAGDTQWINQRIEKLIGTDANIDTYPLIEYPMEYLPAIVEALMNGEEYDICIVDNVLQLGRGSTMDIEKAENLIRNLRRLAVVHECGFIGVMHMNEGTDAKRPRGHGGSEAVREGDLVLRFIQDENETCSFAEAIKARKMKPEKWGISIDGNGLPYYVEVPTAPVSSQAENPDKYADIVAKIPQHGASFTELCKIVAEVKGISTTTAKRWPKRMLDDGAVIARNKRYYKPLANTAVADIEIPF